MNEIFKLSKLIIKKQLKVLNEVEKSQLKTLGKRHPFSKAINVPELVDKMDAYATIDKEKAWDTIMRKIEEKNAKPTVISIFKKIWFRYAAIMLVVALIGGSLFYYKDEIFCNPSTVPTQVVTPKQTIVPGSDKATLTLDDGSVIALEKNDTLNIKNAKSDGEKIVFSNEKTPEVELKYNYLTIPRGGQYHIVLTDGTEVWLNSESQLKFPVTFTKGKTRKVELVYGEAYFSVKHNTTKFIVENNAQEIEVLGTEFNIKAYADETNVYTTLVKGKVAVKTEGENKQLQPSEQSNLDIKTNTISVYEVDVYNEISWKDGLFSFKGKSFNEITKVLSRWYDVEFEFSNPQLKTIKFRGVLSKNQDLEDVLLTIQNLSEIKKFEIYGKTVKVE